MTPWVLLDSAPIPGGGEMRLYRHGRDFSIRVGSDELMNSHAHGSEEALASLAGARLAPGAGRRILVGGLGMGFTAAAALREAGADGQVTVAELVPAIVAWNRTHLAGVGGGVIDDPRLTVRTGDVATLLRSQRAAWDAILLDVDNGPRGLTAGSNRWLYGATGLARAREALRPGGVLAVWSASDDGAFTRRLAHAGFAVEVLPARSHAGRGAHHVVWVGVRR